jgi:FkbM family methyltransferase
MTVDLNKFDNDLTKRHLHNRMGREYWVWRDDRLYEQRFGTCNGPYQVRNIQMLRLCKPKARTIVDIGMNVGNNTMEYATWANTVHGFEPFTPTFELAEVNVALNKTLKLKGRYYPIREEDKQDGWWKQENGTFASLDIIADVHIHNKGLGHIAGIMKIENHPFNAGHNCIVEGDRLAQTKYEVFDVEIVTLDSQNLTEVDCIKVDCEGYEFNVLKGAEHTIRTQRPIVQLEIVDTQCKRFGYSPQDLYDYFTKTIGNYRVCDFMGRDIGQEWEKMKGVMDRFFVPEELYQSVLANREIKKVTHAGMINSPKKKTPFKKRTTNTVNK